MGLVSPSASVMPVVTAVSVWPTCAVPVMVGAPIAGLLVTGAGPLMVKIVRLLVLVQVVSVLTCLILPSPMLHPMAAPVSAVLFALVLTEKPAPLVAALLLVASQ